MHTTKSKPKQIILPGFDKLIKTHYRRRCQICSKMFDTWTDSRICLKCKTLTDKG